MSLAPDPTTMDLTPDPAARRRPPGEDAPPWVIDRPLDPGCAAELRAHLEAGGRAVVAVHPGDEHVAELTGTTVTSVRPATEWFVTLSERAERARLDHEVPIVTGLRLLRPSAPDVEVVATSSVGHEHHPVLAVRTVGRGRVVAAGTADLDALRRHPTLARFVQRLLTAPRRPPPAELGVGVVGYGPFGGMGYVHGLAATETEGLALVAAADSAPARLEAARRDFPDLHTHDTSASLAADPDVDVAVVATPPVHHAELAVALLRAGKHVVVEKPMCLSRSDADLLLDTAADHGRVLTVHQSRRWDRDWLALRRLVETGTIGEVFNVETFVGGFEHPCRAWHSEESISGGAIYDWGSHHVDWLLQLYGAPPRRVLCTTHTRVWLDTTNVDQLALWMQWDDGREATFRQSDVCAIRRPKFHVEGTAGAIEGHYQPMRSATVEPGRGHVETVSHHAEAPVDLRVARYESGHGLVESVVRPAPHPGWGFHRNLADHLLLDEPLAVPPEQSRDVVAVLEAGHRSGAAGGQIVELS